jgi:hypothetical protein
MKTYLAHCQSDYGTEIEDKAIDLLERMGMEIVNPGGKELQSTCVRNSMSYWTGIVDKCEALFFFRFKGHVTAGVGKEIERALEKGSHVFEIVFENGKIVGCRRHEEVPQYLNIPETRKLMGRAA